jgi:hypothetical protein
MWCRKVHPSEFEKFDMMVAIATLHDFNTWIHWQVRCQNLPRWNFSSQRESFSWYTVATIAHCTKSVRCSFSTSPENYFLYQKVMHILSVLSEMKGITYSAMDCDASFDMQKFTMQRQDQDVLCLRLYCTCATAGVPQRYCAPLTEVSDVHADKETAWKMSRMNSMTVVT